VPPFRIVMALIGKAFHYMLQVRLRERQELLVSCCQRRFSDFANCGSLPTKRRGHHGSQMKGSKIVMRSPHVRIFRSAVPLFI
jgi:hypothetical protein